MRFRRNSSERKQVDLGHTTLLLGYNMRLVVALNPIQELLATFRVLDVLNT